MNADQAKKLRAPFPAETIGKLPKPTAKNNQKGRCNECGGWHGLPAVHLDYVGHAAVTDRLLSVDPGWTWEPMAIGPNGEPLLTNGGLWIRLTVCGVTRPGFGDSTSQVGGMKEVIGDAIRNAAMRFGVALDLWSREDLHEMSAGEPGASGDAPAAGPSSSGEPVDPPSGDGPSPPSPAPDASAPKPPADPASAGGVPPKRRPGPAPKWLRDLDTLIQTMLDAELITVEALYAFLKVDAAKYLRPDGTLRWSDIRLELDPKAGAALREKLETLDKNAEASQAQFPIPAGAKGKAA